ncbi:MAG: TonB-dependent receptor [Bacteroidales bacterium]|nr:TonB-dependent receptor [Bacteroidales bacterium]
MKTQIKLTAALLILGLSGFAQNLDKDTIRLQQVVVTATRTERSLSEIPGKADVIPAKMLENMPIQNIDDALRFVSGLNVQRTTGIFSMRPTTTLRGLSGDEQGRTLVLLNGIPLNTSDEGGVNWNRINAEDIERIEVFKGPGSSMYGNNAMGGVINIITKKPVKPIEGTVGVCYGTFNTMKPEASVSGKLENGLSYRLSGYYLNSDGYNNIPDSLRSDPDYSVARYLTASQVSAVLGYELHELLNIEIQYDFYREKRSEGEKIQAPDGEYRHFNNNVFRTKFYGKKDKLKYDISMFYVKEDYFRIDERMRGGNYSRFDVKADRIETGALLNTLYELNANHTIAAGIDFKEGSVDGGDYYQTSEDVVLNRGKMSFLAFYLQDEMSLLKNKIKLLAGLRFDNNSFYDGYYFASGSGVDYWMPYNGNLEENNWSSLSPRIAMRYLPNKKISAYISYSRGFRASILDDLCRSGWMWVGPKIANPELGPETLDNFELGLDFKPGKKIVFSPTVFYSIGKDFLYYVATGDSIWGTRPIFRRENVSLVTIKGLETDFKYYINKNFTFMANYTYNESVIEEFEEQKDLEGKSLKYVPKHQVMAGLMVNFNKFSSSVQLLNKSKQFTDDANKNEIDGFTTIDLNFSYKIMNKKLMIGLGIQDLLDNKFMQTDQYMSPGRLINGKLLYRF